MASSLNLLVLRLAQFHSENGLGGISELLGRNEEELIAAAIAEHRASLSVQQRTRICSHTNSLVQVPQKSLAPLLSSSSTKAISWLSVSSQTSSNSSLDSQINFSSDRNCCRTLFTCRKRKRRHWHLRRSPQNIKHLLYFNQFIDNHKLTLVRTSILPNHIPNNLVSKQQRISI